MEDCLTCEFAEWYQGEGLTADCICDPPMGECPADKPKQEEVAK